MIGGRGLTERNKTHKRRDLSLYDRFLFPGDCVVLRSDSLLSPMNGGWGLIAVFKTHERHDVAIVEALRSPADRAVCKIAVRSIAIIAAP